MRSYMFLFPLFVTSTRRLYEARKYSAPADCTGIKWPIAIPTLMHISLRRRLQVGRDDVHMLRRKPQLLREITPDTAEILINSIKECHHRPGPHAGDAPNPIVVQGRPASPGGLEERSEDDVPEGLHTYARE